MSALPFGYTARQISEEFAVLETADPLAYNASAVVAEMIDAILIEDRDRFLDLMRPLPKDLNLRRATCWGRKPP